LLQNIGQGLQYLMPNSWWRKPEYPVKNTDASDFIT